MFVIFKYRQHRASNGFIVMIALESRYFGDTACLARREQKSAEAKNFVVPIECKDTTDRATKPQKSTRPLLRIHDLVSYSLRIKTHAGNSSIQNYGPLDVNISFHTQRKQSMSTKKRKNVFCFTFEYVFSYKVPDNVIRLH